MHIVDNLEWVRIFWVLGTQPRGYARTYQVKNPPTSGWQGAFIIRGEKRSTIFCPHSFESWQVSNNSAEIHGAVSAKFDREWMSSYLKRQWAMSQRFGAARDYDMATLVMKKLGLEVPKETLRGGEIDTRVKGGKETGAVLIRPVKASTRRGKFLQWLLDNKGSCTVREAMAEFSITRNNALSYLFLLKKDHGIGYTLIGDTATITLPEGCTNPIESKELASADDWLN